LSSEDERRYFPKKIVAKIFFEISFMKFENFYIEKLTLWMKSNLPHPVVVTNKGKKTNSCVRIPKLKKSGSVTNVVR